MLVAVDHDRVGLAPRDRHRGDLPGQAAVGRRLGGPLLGPQGEPVLVLAADPEVGGDVLGRLRHRVDPVLRLQHRVHEPPADGRVVELGVAVEGGGRLADDERRPAHALHPAGDDQVGLPGPDLPGPDGHRVRPRPAQPVDGRPGHLHRQPGQQHRHPGHVPVVLARLVGAPQDHVVDRRPVHRRQPPRQRPHDMGGQVVRPDPGQHPAIPPKRRPHPIDQIRLTHGSRPPPRPLVQPIGLVAETVRLAASWRGGRRRDPLGAGAAADLRAVPCGGSASRWTAAPRRTSAPVGGSRRRPGSSAADPRAPPRGPGGARPSLGRGTARLGGAGDPGAGPGS